LVTNLRKIVTYDLPRLGGTWVTAFFLVGLLVGVRNPEAARLRYFVLACLIVLVVVQAATRTQLSEDSPDVNSENLLVLLAPVVLIYGVSLLTLLIEQVDLPVRELRYALTVGAGALLCLPLLLAFLPPHQIPLAYPPYNPPWIQEYAAKYTTKDELLMSDIPWATAWYGRRQCVWLPANGLEGFYAINDLQKSIQELYFSPLTLNSMALTQLTRRTSSSNWDGFVLETVARSQMEIGGVPKGFPLHYPQPGLPYQFVLTYRQHEIGGSSQ
jgi:hypothetical protein